MATFFALIAFFSWGVADIYAALSSRKIGNLGTFIIIQLVGMSIFAILFPFFAGTFDLFYFIVAFVLGIIDNFGLLFFYKAFETGNVPLNGMIAGSFGLVIVFVSLIFFGEKIGAGEILGIAFIFAGIVLSSLRLNELLEGNAKRAFKDKGMVYAFLTMIFWGVYFGFLRIPAEKMGWYYTLLPLSLCWPFLLLFKKGRRGILKVIKNINGAKYGILHALTAFGGTIAFNLGIMQGNTSLVGPIATASPALFVVLSRFVFADRLSEQQWLGIGMTLLGIVILGFS